MSGYAITTRYVGPTDYRGSRVIATGPALTWGSRQVRATVPWEYGASNGTGMSEAEANARAAALLVATKLRNAGWHVSLSARGAMLPDESGYVFLLDYDREGRTDDDTIRDALTGPLSGATARRITPSVREALAAEWPWLR